jgi:multicomponent Na+:H+ antiporter subunit A
LYGTLAGTKLSTSLLFDVGVYAAVLGVVMVAFDQLGASSTDESPAEEPAAETPADRTQEGAV